MDAVAINAMYSYAGDISHKSDKRSASIRFLIIDTFIYLFTPLGIYCGDFILKHFGFLWVFLSVTSLFCISAVYAILFLSNIVPYTKKENGEEKIASTASTKPEGKAEGMKPLKILQELTQTLTKKRSQYGRGIIIILLMILGTHSISYTTDTNISYIALQTKLGLGESEISNTLAMGLVICGVGNLLLMAVIHFTDINVMVVGLISCLSELGYYLE